MYKKKMAARLGSTEFVKLTISTSLDEVWAHVLMIGCRAKVAAELADDRGGHVNQRASFDQNDTGNLHGDSTTVRARTQLTAIRFNPHVAIDLHGRRTPCVSRRSIKHIHTTQYPASPAECPAIGLPLSPATPAECHPPSHPSTTACSNVLLRSFLETDGEKKAPSNASKSSPGTTVARQSLHSH